MKHIAIKYRLTLVAPAAQVIAGYGGKEGKFVMSEVLP